MRRRFRSALFGLAVVVLTAVSTRPAGANATCGDLSGDGFPRINDALILLQALVDPATAVAACNGVGALECGDMNADGALTIADVVILLNFLAGNPILNPPCTVIEQISDCTDGPAGASVLQAADHTPSWRGQKHVSGNIDTSQIWVAGCRYDVDGFVFVEPGVTLTIQPGALVVGVPPTTGSIVSGLIFKRGSKISAKGTPTQPIIMTSSAHVDAGHGSVGDWGGITINGNAPVNCPGGECLAEGLVGIPFGGPDANDSSGVMEYVRVEFGGKLLDPGGNSMRNITLNGVGRRTIYDHVQANVGFDDCQAWYGGTVNGKFLVSSGCGDDLFDMQLGTQSRVQYGLGVYYQPFMQDLGDEAIEWDDNENGFDFLPRTAPAFCNVTIVGTALQPSVGLGKTEVAMNLRRGTAGTLANVVAEHFRITGLNLRDNATAAVACDGPTELHTASPRLLVTHSLFFDDGFAGDGTTPGRLSQVSGGTGISSQFTSPCTANQYWSLLAAQESVVPADPTTVGPDPGLPVKYGLGMADSQTDLGQFVPDGSQPLVTTLATDCHAIDPYFDTTGFLGAFDPTKASWLTSPWISFELE